MQKFFYVLKYICSIVISALIILYILAFPLIIKLTQKSNPLLEIYGTTSSPIVLDMWYIESFEGGISSRKAFLEKSVKAFNKVNKNVYISVTTMTKEQYKLNINDKSPDLISFSDREIYNTLIDLPKLNRVERYISDIEYDGDIVCYPYMLGRYAIISKEPITTEIPNDIITYNKKTIYPFGYSLDVLGHMYIQENGYSLPSNSKTYSTQYEVYNAFLKGDLQAFLGSQRDVHRLKAREQKGSIEECFYKYLGGTTDLVQYIGVTKLSKYIDQAKLFCRFLIEECDQYIADIGMFSPYTNLYQEQYMLDWENSIKGTKLGGK